MPAHLNGKMTFFTLPAEIRIMIYQFVLEDGLDLPLYTTDITKSGHTGPIPYEHWKKKAANMNTLATICRQIKWEAVDPLFFTTQLYIHHQEHIGGWIPGGPTTDYELTIELITNQPVLREARHVRWTVYPGSDEGVWFPYDHTGVNLVRQRFSPANEGLRPSCPVSFPWLTEKLKNLETLHLDVDWRIDWIDLCVYSRWLYPIFQKVKKLTLSLNFEGKEIYYERARNSRYVKRGKPEWMMEANILNHILTLPEVCISLIRDGVDNSERGVG